VMKVRLLSMVAAVAIAVCAQANAQEGESLERALADLNNGVIAPSAQNGAVSALGSSSLGISGDARIRNTWLNPVNKSSDQKNVDARLRLGFEFDVNPDAGAYVLFNAHENWGAVPGLGRNVATREAPNLNTGSVEQAYFTGRNVIFEGEEWRFGRSAYNFGSGRILGTDDWNQLPASYSGVWYSNSFEGVAFESFMITDIFNAGGFNGNWTRKIGGAIPGDRDLYGLMVDWGFDGIDFLGDVDLNPYILRLSSQGAPNGTQTWYGFEAGGGLTEVVDWDFEAVWVDSERINDPSMGDFSAIALDFDIDLTELLGDGLPAGLDPSLTAGLAKADAANPTINPVYHDTAGIYDLQNRLGRPGVWSGQADSWYLGLSAEPVEGWESNLTLVHFDDSNPAGGNTNADARELDLSVAHTFHNGTALWVGWGWVDFNALSSDAFIAYASLSLPF